MASLFVSFIWDKIKKKNRITTIVVRSPKLRVVVFYTRSYFNDSLRYSDWFLKTKTPPDPELHLDHLSTLSYQMRLLKSMSDFKRNNATQITPLGKGDY